MSRVFTIEFRNGAKRHYNIGLWEIFIGESMICIESIYDGRKEWFDKDEIKYLYTNYE